MNWISTISSANEEWKYDSKNKIVYGSHYAYVFIDLSYLGLDYGYWYMIGTY